MPWWQPLKGVLSRHYADWNVQNLATISGNCDGTNNRQSFIFFNNSNPAVYFYVYGIIISTNQSVGIDDFGWMPTGDKVNNQTTLPFAVIGNQPQPPGRMDQRGPSKIYAGAAGAQIVMIGAQIVVLDSASPWFVVPPNSGYELGPTGGGDNWFLTLKYVWK